MKNVNPLPPNYYIFDPIKKSMRLTLPHKVSDCLGLEDRCLLRKAGVFFEMENVNSFPPNYYKFEIKGLSGKDMGIRNNSSLLGKLK